MGRHDLTRTIPLAPIASDRWTDPDTSTKRVFTGTIWTTDSPPAATIIVAASDSTEPWKASYNVALDRLLICDGTADDVEIQAAIDAMPANGGDVVLLEGTYNVLGDGVDIDDTNIALRGSGFGTIIKLTADQSTDEATVIISADNCQIRDLTIDGNRDNQGVAIRQPGLKVTSDYVTVERIHATQTIEHAISLEGANYCNIQGSFCSYFGDDGISVNPDDADNICTFVTIRGNTCWHALGTTSSGVEVQDGCTDVSVIGNLFWDTGKPGSAEGGAGISIGSHAGEPATGRVSCIGNQFGANYPTYYVGSGISVTSDPAGGRPYDVTIVGNNFGKAIYSQAIRLTYCDRAIVSENTMGWTVNSVVYIYDSTDIIFSENILYDIRTQAQKMLRIENSSYVRVTDNIIDCVSNCDNAISEEGTSDYNYFRDNIIRNYDVAPLVIVGPHTVTHEPHVDVLEDVLASSANLVVNAQNFVDGAIALTGVDPNYPRGLVFAITAGVTEYTLTVVGIDAKGGTITEVFTFAEDGLAFSSDAAFDSVTSITLADRAGAAATLDVGIDERLGVRNRIYATADVWKITKNLARQVVAGAQVDVNYDTYDMSVIGLALNDDFVISYRSNLNDVS